eukprot:80617_1
MGATCEPCEIDYQSRPDQQPSRSIPTFQSTSAIGEHAHTNDITNTRTHSLSQSSTSMSLIATVCASLEAPEMLQSDASKSVSMDEGDYAEAAMEALEFQRDSLRLTAKRLVPLKGWLEKKQCSPPYSWQKRYVVVQDGQLLWSDREMTIANGITQREKKRWNKSVSLKRIVSVTQTQSKKHCKFRLSMKSESGSRLWKASSKRERDEWIDGLNAHVVYAKQKSLVRCIDI